MPTPAILVLALALITANFYGKSSGVMKGIESKIYQGSFAKQSYPFYVAFVAKDKTKNESRIFCGGSLVDNQNVLTAAHCVVAISRRLNEKQVLMAYFSPLNISDFRGKQIPIDSTTKLIPHPQYRIVGATAHSDIGIVKLSQLVELGSTYSSICIGKTKITNQPVMLTGFGRYNCKDATNYLRYATGHTTKCILLSAKDQPKNTVCADLKNAEGKNSEHAEGDSGGPLFTTFRRQTSNKNNYAQVGIVSFSYKNHEGCPDRQYPYGVYNIPGRYMPFLQRHSNATLCK